MFVLCLYHEISIEKYMFNLILKKEYLAHQASGAHVWYGKYFRDMLDMKKKDISIFIHSYLL